MTTVRVERPLAAALESDVRDASRDSEAAAPVEVLPNQGPGGAGAAGEDQFLVLLKPELLDQAGGVAVRACVELVLERLAAGRVRVGGARSCRRQGLPG